MFEVKEIPIDKKCSWTVCIDGKERRVKQICLTSQFGTFMYGLRPEGYDGWVFEEQNGGGAVTIPYAYTTAGTLLIGLLLEKRLNIEENKSVWCAIGGFIDQGETHEQAQTREAQEETGINAVQAKKLPGMLTNSNRAFWITDEKKSKGIHAYGLRVNFGDLELGESGNYKLKATALFSGFKKSNDMRFFRWDLAIQLTPDALARSAIAQLLSCEFGK